MNYMSILVFLISTLLITPPTLSLNEEIYIVQVDTSLIPKPYINHHNWYLSLVESVRAINSSSVNFLYSYSHVFNGFSAVFSEFEIEIVKDLVGVIAVYRDTSVKLHTTHSIEFLSLNNSTGLWPASKYGEDVIIGVADTGIWPESPSFHDNGMSQIPKRWRGVCENHGKEFNSSMCNKKLIGARVFYKGVEARSPTFKQRFMHSPRDSLGHGTHTSSIAAGNYVENVSHFGYAKGTAKGVAPRARLAMYKITPDENQDLSASDSLAAMDQAVADGVDILSLSFGGDETDWLYENTIAVASFGAMEKGVFVSASAGNDGQNSYNMYVSNGFPWALTVGASSIDRSFAGTITLGNGKAITGWTLYPNFENVLLDNICLRYNDSNLSSCNDADLLSGYEGCIVVCKDKTPFLANDFVLLEGYNAKVAGVIMIADGVPFNEDQHFYFPAVVVSSADSQSIIAYSRSNKDARASIKFKQTIIGTKPAPIVSSYSSRGPSRYTPGILKPDLLAPGTLILGAIIPPHLSAPPTGEKYYQLLSGTSMSCPHASGVAALLKGAHPDWSPAVLRSAMITTTDIIDNTNNSIGAFFSKNVKAASPLDMGAGHINPNRALDPGLVYDIIPRDYVNYLCAMNYTQEQIIRITRSKKYDCSTPSDDINYPSFVAMVSKNSSYVVKVFRRTVTNVGKGKARYTAKIVQPQNCMVTVLPDTLYFQRKNDKKSYSLRVQCVLLKDMLDMFSYGWLAWVEDKGARIVRSPILAMFSL